MHDFHYRLPARMGGQRPGAHPGTSRGAGQEFVAHSPLFNRPDPRRLDVRASLRDARGDWLVRVTRQRVGVPVYALVDVSASMVFGAARSKLAVAADFVEAMGQSAFRVGDAAGMVAFDTREREDLLVPASMSRGSGYLMSSLLRDPARVEQAAPGERHRGDPQAGLAQAALRLAGRQSLVFLVSDVHWDYARLDAVLDQLARAWLVPLVIWDPAELEPPAENGMVALRDAESGAERMLWLRPKLRAQWRDAAQARRAAIQEFFLQRGRRAFFATGAFDADAMSEYFFEAAA
ncbi:MAG: hypothetical protein NVS9B10_09150 [Nevskia sp.]